ncbi:hypothetical protein FOCC_FOCC014823 [Frankliniella occidentalis]|nr:hypothetical protein FOCC_FOCC014823 [Frankliniella occidentalis]
MSPQRTTNIVDLLDRRLGFSIAKVSLRRHDVQVFDAHVVINYPLCVGTVRALQRVLNEAFGAVEQVELVESSAVWVNNTFDPTGDKDMDEAIYTTIAANSLELKRGGECLVRDVVFGGGRQVRLCLGEEEGHLGVPLRRRLGDVPLDWRGELLVLPGGLEGGVPHAQSGFEEIANHVKCRQCGSDVTFCESGVRGLGFSIVISCDCEVSPEIKSCPLIGTKKNAFEVNRRAVFAMRNIGLRLTALKTFCGIIDLNPPVWPSAHDVIVDSICTAAV